MKYISERKRPAIKMHCKIMVANHKNWYHPALKAHSQITKFAYPCRLMVMVMVIIRAKLGSSECLVSRPRLGEDAWMPSGSTKLSMI